MPVYHATFMEQLLRLLRAKCAYCSHLKLHPTEVHRYVCKLRLVEFGLLEEAADLDNIQTSSRTAKANRTDQSTIDQSTASSDLSEDDSDRIIQRRNLFVKRSIKSGGGRRELAEASKDKVEAVFVERRAIIKDFLANITKPKTCGTCKG